MPEPRTVPEMVGEQARRAPEAIACVDGDRRTTYREIDTRAHALAAVLARLTTTTGDERTETRHDRQRNDQ